MYNTRQAGNLKTEHIKQAERVVGLVRDRYTYVYQEVFPSP